MRHARLTGKVEIDHPYSRGTLVEYRDIDVFLIIDGHGKESIRVCMDYNKRDFSRGHRRHDGAFSVRYNSRRGFSARYGDRHEPRLDNLRVTLEFKGVRGRTFKWSAPVYLESKGHRHRGGWAKHIAEGSTGARFSLFDRAVSVRTGLSGRGHGW